MDFGFWILDWKAILREVVKERVGLYGGSFDPIHFGHLILAREAREQLGLDRVVFIPAGVSPFKLDAPPAGAEVRLEMVRAAVTGEPGFEVSDLEVRREGASFAIQTVRELRERWGEAVEFFYFIGDDNLADLDKWREIARVAAVGDVRRSGPRRECGGAGGNGAGAEADRDCFDGGAESDCPGGINSIPLSAMRERHNYPGEAVS